MRENNYEQLKEGDSSALVHIHARYSRMVYWVGKRIINDDFVVESLVQDTFLKLWANRDKIESEKHLFFFLRMVMKRECYSYYTSPQCKFFQKINSLESYDNYQDYLAGYDPKDDAQNWKDQESQQGDFDQIIQVLPLLQPDRKRLIELCLKYEFRYKIIAKLMGTGITETRNEVNKAILDLKNIINQNNVLEVSQQSIIKRKDKVQVTAEQLKVLKLRCKHNYSFASIANELNISQKDVHKAFIQAYKLMQEINENELEPV
ncbi:RNA polymerase sigma factor, sigma-70 family [Gillisia sp. Hel1_33_143]|uniref:RNA polymerase sigma factor n=1 Tax=Gillisia sp. Hel1_33_143 TaxID=1336796 RepID=UPI00087DD799|nr:sigma-70 family RNA polymerase sigma factor [Gillisia sp. Hel1_33_143]SDS75460.1 RNA polymerase sigma factor, sigma-70 family [Gillisia sp. Hel1_33_143]